MPEDIVKIDTITQLHEIIGYDKPKHPLISLINVEKLIMLFFVKMCQWVMKQKKYHN